MSKNEKKKKKKVKYIDDGRTVADMSGLYKAKGWRETPGRVRSTRREQMGTYWRTVKMMFVPMLITIGIISLAFGLVWLLL